jgi:hypothetical protein
MAGLLQRIFADRMTISYSDSIRRIDGMDYFQVGIARVWGASDSVGPAWCLVGIARVDSAVSCASPHYQQALFVRVQRC